MTALRPAILLALLMSAPAGAQEDDPASIEHTKIVSVKAMPDVAKPGDTVHIVVTVRIDPEWHIYSPNKQHAPTEWKFEGPVERVGDVVEPPPKYHREVIGKEDDGSDKIFETYFHEGEVMFRVPVRITKDAPAGALTLKGRMTGQECDPKVCIQFDYPVETTLTIKKDEAAAGGTTTPLPQEPELHTRIVSIKCEPPTARAGEVVQMVFTVRMDPGWHIYSAVKEYNQTQWQFAADSPVDRAGDVVEPQPKYKKEKFADESFLEYWYHEGEVTFRVPIRIKAGTKPGPVTIAGTLTGQECSNACIDLSIPFSAAGRLEVTEGGATTAPAIPPPPPTDDAPDDKPESFLGLILLGVLGGAISLIMPCVYPLLPVTLTYFIKQGGESRAKSVAMTTAYAAGIILVFTGVGFLFSILWGADGPRIFAANPWVNLAVGALFFWFAFSLLGLYEINLPSWMTGPLTSQQRTGVGGSFILGALFSVVTFTCTIPIAAGILAVAATSGIENKFTGLVAMLVYSATMAAPFVVLGLFPSLIKEIPKSGGWLHTVKVTAGLAEIALALMYFAVADQVTDTGFLTRPLMIAVWVAILGTMAFYLLGLFRLKDDGPPAPVGVVRVMMAMVFGVMAVYMGSGINSKHLGALDILLPVAPPEAIGNYPEALEEAKRAKKPIFLEFTGFS